MDGAKEGYGWGNCPSSTLGYGWGNCPSSTNLTGFYTDDFPDKPLEFYDFVSDTLPANTTESLLATKVKVLEYRIRFHMVGAGGGNFDFDKDPQSYNLVDPPFVNTATLPKDGWIAVRFKALNPGVWLWHCHLDRHLSWGMNTVIIVQNGATPETSILPPPPHMPSCDAPSTIKKKTSQFSAKQTTT
ncbi:hypothetical protein Pint_06505 [Pistacia integerrima]|uniref:Uncharacterized protein n=1 Tax=Pistacia integerrima TaxID=434235 RepID=A0ACC0Z2P9_9ROSI|nr:hypothetical protein Pint_06505 [Pistacia integerrima]